MFVLHEHTPVSLVNRSYITEYWRIVPLSIAFHYTAFPARRTLLTAQGSLLSAHR
jgi:hypothetical protein